MERRFRKSKLKVDKELCVDACERYNSLLETTKTTFYRMKIEQIDSKKLFYNIDAMFMHKSSPLPAKESVDVLVESFNNFFIQKIDLKRHSLIASQDQQTLFHDPGHLSSSITHSLSDFHRPDVQSIISTVKSLTSKTCQLDPIPTHVVKQNLPSLSTIICNIVKSSLSTAQFPDILKLSYILPCLKKPLLDKELYQSYRPLTNILFLCKIIEDTAKTQIFNYLDANTLLPSFQSACRRCHSTETALLRVQNDILRSLDTNQQVIMVLLDLSSALKWFRSCLSGRSQSVVLCILSILCS